MSKTKGSMLAQASGGKLTNVSWSTVGKLSYQHWLNLGQQLAIMERNAAWWIGDWLIYGEAQYGKKYEDALRVTGYELQTLTNFVYVANKFEPERRRESLSFSHHAEVAALIPEDQERFLDLANQEELSVRELRYEVRNSSGTSRPKRPVTIEAAPPREPTPTANLDSDITCPHCGKSFVLE